ncbi:hypothetical protein Pla175_48820 [Pirellulimonas nuda]|uniref:Recombinase zinc beta ribbon domain-containing protein n=2 Tax=Pirellulimonas nuda TaxID=2528009 RepID=A0A518DJ00_9BACT|nr:hypothetical protein Pla175_48820 [Pirellulimonas nuda]
MDQWETLIRDHHPGYISWEEYVRNQEQLELNVGQGGRSGAAKSGPALLAGLLRCRRCGRNLHVGYSGIDGRVPRYFCRGAHLNHGTDRCISFGGLRADRAVSDAVLAAIEPAGVHAALDAWEQLCQQEGEKQKALQLSLEKAIYDVDLARRQYDAVDPANRLVAAELEARWNDALRRRSEMQTRLEAAAHAEPPLSEGLRGRLLELGADLASAWNHPAAPVEMKKRILRTVLAEIVVDVTQEPPRIVMTLHWAGGVHTKLSVAKNPTGRHRKCTDKQVVELVGELAKVSSDAKIASILNRLGYRTGVGNTWVESRVYSLRKYHKIPCVAHDQREWLTLADAARELAISAHSVRKLLTSGTLPGRQIVAYAPWIIERQHLNLPAVQEAAGAIREGRRIPRRDPRQLELPLK